MEELFKIDEVELNNIETYFNNNNNVY